MRVRFPGESDDPLVFSISGIDVDYVEVVNVRGQAIRIRSGQKLPAGFGTPEKLRIHPRP